jgi:hypothetical protein
LEGGPHDGLALTVEEPLAMLEVHTRPAATYGLRLRDPKRDPPHLLRYGYVNGRGHGLAGFDVGDSI